MNSEPPLCLFTYTQDADVQQRPNRPALKLRVREGLQCQGIRAVVITHDEVHVNIFTKCHAGFSCWNNSFAVQNVFIVRL